MNRNKEIFPMKNKGLLFLSMLLMLPALTGCKERSYYNFAKKLNTTELGNSSIQNISKYKALGVGSLSSFAGKKKLLSKSDLINLRSEETDDNSSYDYSLLGLTNDGFVEELTLITNNGESILSSNLNITYYDEIGDFIIFSFLPMSTEDYKAGLLSPDDMFEYKEWDYNTFHKCYMDKLCYPLIHAIRYKDGKDYKFIDTTYLIHKKSGKMFPCSTHGAYIDIAEVSPGCGFIRLSDYRKVLPSENEATLGDILFGGFWDGTTYRGAQSAPYEDSDYYMEDYYFEPDHYTRNWFPNGFISCSGDFLWQSFKYISGCPVSIVTFDETSNTILVEQPANFSINTPFCDKWGNLYVETVAGFYLYRKSDKTFMLDIDASVGYDYWSRQFYLKLPGNNKYSFLGEDLSVEYTFDNLKLSQYSQQTEAFDLLGLASRFVNFKDKVYLKEYGSEYLIMRVILDENGHYTDDSYREIAKFDRNVGLLNVYGRYFYIFEGVINYLDRDDDYSHHTIEVPYTVNGLFMDENNCLKFTGFEKATLSSVEGYITENNEVSFEVQTPKPSKISTFSPIN